MGKKLSKRVVMHWNRMPGEVGRLLSLEVSKDRGDVALGDVVMGMVGVGWWLDLVILVVFSNLNGSMIL